MRVGLLTTSFPRHAQDSAGAFVLGFARCLVASGHEVEVLAPQPREPGDAPRFEGIDAHFVPYTWPRTMAHTFYGAGVPDNLNCDARAWPGLASYPVALWRAARARADHWDAVVSHWAIPSGWVASHLPRRPPHLAVIHSADVHALERLPIGSHLARRVASSSERMLFVSQDLRTRFCALLGSELTATLEQRVSVSPMGVPDPAPMDRERARCDLNITDFTALSLGRLVAIKGIEDAIRASTRAGVSLCIAGDGPERARLEQVASRSRGHVRFLGHVTGAHKQALLAAADAFVLPSRRLPSGRTEGTPTALLEAMAAGLPPVAAQVGGVGDVIDHGVSGLLFQHGREQELGSALSRLRTDAGLREALSHGARDVGMAHTWSALGPRFAADLDATLRA